MEMMVGYLDCPLTSSVALRTQPMTMMLSAHSTEMGLARSESRNGSVGRERKKGEFRRSSESAGYMQAGLGLLFDENNTEAQCSLPKL
jgi:hypothetical protein